MYVVLVDSKSREAMADLMVAIIPQFKSDTFSIHGSEEKGYQFRIEGAGDEKAPRAFAQSFLKKWKPKPPEPEVK